MKYLLVIFTLLLGSHLVSAQTYNTAIGLRMGSGIGLSVKQRVGNKFTLEGIVNNRFKQDQVTATILGERHFPILFKRFNVYTGLGAHKGWYTADTTDEGGNVIEDPYGISFIGGAEVSIGRFNVSYDYKPAFNIKGGTKAFTGESSLTLRYIIVKRPTKLQKWKKDRKKRKKKKQKEKEKEGGFDWKDIFKKED